MYEKLYNQLIPCGQQAEFELPHWIALAPFEEYLGMRIDSAADGKAVLSMPFKLAHCQGKGLMHGGAIAALADTSLAIAIKTMLPDDTHFATIEMQMRFHAPISSGVVTAKAAVISLGERDIDGEVAVFAEDGVKAVTFTARFRRRLAR